MQWWNDVFRWFDSTEGQRVLSGAIVPFAAILVAGVVAAIIGRGSTTRVLTLHDRENRVAAVAAMIGSARRASVWNTLSGFEQQNADHVASEADARIRLLPVTGSRLAADWAAHRLVAMKRDSVSFSFQAERSLVEFRDRMVEWQARPKRARKLFSNDLELWDFDDAQATRDIIDEQQAWAASQAATETGATPARMTTSEATPPVAGASETPPTRGSSSVTPPRAVGGSIADLAG